MKQARNGTAIDWFEDDERIERAMAEATLEAVRSHKLMGDPIAIWRDGKVVSVPPEEIELEEGNGSGPVQK